MTANPDPAHITDPLWRFWQEFDAAEPPVLLGGIYAAKDGYHDTRKGNPSNDYSVRDPIDQQGPGDKAAALDLTFPDAQAGNYTTIAKYSRRLLDAGRNRDPRLYRDGEAILREFYGNADDDTEVEGWDYRYHVGVSSDSSHLWHIHLSFTRAFANDWPALSGVLAVLLGEEHDDMSWDESLKNTVYPSASTASGNTQKAKDRLVTTQGRTGDILNLVEKMHAGLGALRGEVAGLTALVQQLATMPPVPVTADQLAALTAQISAAAARGAESALERVEVTVRDQPEASTP